MLCAFMMAVKGGLRRVDGANILAAPRCKQSPRCNAFAFTRYRHQFYVVCPCRCERLTLTPVASGQPRRLSYSRRARRDSELLETVQTCVASHPYRYPRMFKVWTCRLGLSNASAV